MFNCSIIHDKEQFNLRNWNIGSEDTKSSNPIWVGLATNKLLPESSRISNFI